ncbi:hypothetical protein [Roseovarius sp.]|uniref:hypothetical protein n=1 Tax=Roseovarius sp. TaxID=1486281 RepID=UPI00257D40B2|nr:hypothetical protein [Roseovarius sp.]
MFIASVVSLFLYLIYWVDLSFISKFTLFARLQQVAGGYYGLRDQLLAESMGLLGDKSICLALGCGFSYFQHYYGYAYGLYPHNQLVELVIVFGLPFSLVFIGFTAIGCRRLFKGSGAGFLFALLWGYSAVVALKSGSVDSTSLFIPLSFMCICHSGIVFRSRGPSPLAKSS